MPLTSKHYQSVRNHFIKLLGEKCIKCGTIKNLELDHIIPNGWGGGRGRDKRMWDWFESHAENNLQILCSSCNNHKH